jgi:hypothetical protein
MITICFVFYACEPLGHQIREESSDSFAKYGQELKGKIAKSYEESEEWWPSTPKPPAGTPNVLLILLDDTGFGHLGCFGGLTETPNIDQLAEENNVYPLYDDMIMRIAKQQDRLFGDRKEFVYWYPGAQRIAEKASAPVKGKSHSIETTLNLTGKEEGVIVACGGFAGGYTLFIRNNKAYYDYNYYNGLYYTLESPPLGKGEVHIKFDFVEKGSPKRGIPGGVGALYINGDKVDETTLDEMHISTFSLSETFDVGIDAGTPVSNKYSVKNHFPFTGELDKVIVKLTE